MRRIGVLLLDFGGPLSEADVEPYLRRLFSDPAILPVPDLVRPLLARLIARRRAPVARSHYAAIGGGSPEPAAIAEMASALGDHLAAEVPDVAWDVRPAFTYAPPLVDDVVAALAGRVDGTVALPAFPQRSWATTDAALAAVRRAGHRADVPTLAELGSFPTEGGLLDALGAGLLPRVGPGSHVLFVAHGIPMRNERRGDPYVAEVRATVDALAARLPPGTPWSLAFQSRLGPVAWVGPFLEDEVARLGAAGVASLVVAPVSFLVENLETLYDLDTEAPDLVAAAGIRDYRRAPAPGPHPALIRALGHRVRQAVIEKE